MTMRPGTRGNLRPPGRRQAYAEETIMDLIIKFSCDERGASAVEYSLLVAFIALVIASGVQSFGVAVRGLFDNAVAKWPG
jgi:Flp pilus assembly pilin Flp